MVDFRIITLRDGLVFVSGGGGAGKNEGGDVDGMFMFQRPSPEVLLWPWKINLLFLETRMVCLVKRTVHSSSHNCPTEMRLLWRFGKSDVLVA